MTDTEKKGPDWLLPYVETDTERVGRDVTLYRLAALREKLDVRQLPGGWLVVRRHEHPGSVWMSFAVFRFAQSATDGSRELDELVFYGDGPGGKPGESLRECRHTYWGEDGYIFYPDGRLITAAFRELAEFFDDMVAE